jgi:hypothetical protein
MGAKNGVILLFKFIQKIFRFGESRTSWWKSRPPRGNVNKRALFAQVVTSFLFFCDSFPVGSNTLPVKNTGPGFPRV